MKASGYLPKTDSRFRGDQRLFEEGKWDEADVEKVRLEEKQRTLRKELSEKGEEFQPMFFEQTEKLNPITKKVEVSWQAKKGDDNYWVKRAKQEWEGLPDIF